jgi:hypothetical protein
MEILKQITGSDGTRFLCKCGCGNTWEAPGNVQDDDTCPSCPPPVRHQSRRHAPPRRDAEPVVVVTSRGDAPTAVDAIKITPRRIARASQVLFSATLDDTQLDRAFDSGATLANVEFRQIADIIHNTSRADVTGALKWYTDDVVMPLVRGIEALAARVKELERSAKGLSYQGVWRQKNEHNEPVTYAANTAVTHKGCLWISRSDTDKRPGDGPSETSGWTLAVKAGRNAKDAK